jgi:hypothetical protein
VPEAVKTPFRLAELAGSAFGVRFLQISVLSLTTRPIVPGQITERSFSDKKSVSPEEANFHDPKRQFSGPRNTSYLSCGYSAIFSADAAAVSSPQPSFATGVIGMSQVRVLSCSV